MKRKKISIKYYGNTKLKPNNDGSYPVYVRVNYNRKNTQFPLWYPFDGAATVEETFVPRNKEEEKPGLYLIQQSEEVKELTGLSSFEEVIEAIVRYEEQKVSDDSYSLKGLSERCNFYAFNLIDRIGEKLEKEVVAKLKPSKFIAATRHTHGINTGDFSTTFPLMEKAAPGVIDYLKKDKQIYLSISAILTLKLFNALQYPDDDTPPFIRWFDFRFNGYDKKYVEFISKWHERKHHKSLTKEQESALEYDLKLIPQFPPTEELDSFDYLKFLEDLAYKHLGEYL